MRLSVLFLAVLLSIALTDPPSIKAQGCNAPVCGNGIAEGTEECDDGNTNSGDGCSATCQLENSSAVCAGVPTVAGTALDSVRVASGLVHPVHVTAPRLDPNRVFVVEQPGRIRIIKNGALLATPFLAIESRVLSAGSEQGLLSVAFHPDFETNGFLFVNYTRQTDGATVIARYQVSGNPDVADAGSEHVLLTIPQPFANHNGGLNVFGPDGFLYVGMGDGGSGCDPNENAQNDASLLGKLLRINVSTETYQIWAKGLRNPWRFSFDRATGDLYIADVGQNLWEEVDYQPAPAGSGLNYGWDFYEGRHCSSGSGCPDPCPAPTGLTMPVLEYCHSQVDPACGSHPRGCAITGGFVYRGCRMPDLRGTYFYSDYCTAFIRTFRGVLGGNAQNLADRTADVAPGGGLSIGSVTSFGEDARGELYITDQGSGAADGEVFKLVPGS